MGQLFLITGDDLSSIQASAKKIIHALVGDTPDEFSCETIREDTERSTEEILQSLMEALLTPSFLGGDKTVILQNFSAFSDEPAKSIKNPSGTSRRLRELADFIANRFPDDMNLIMSGPGANKAKALYKACASVGKAEFHKKPDLKDFKWRQSVAQLMRERAAERQMQLTSTTLEYLTEVIGTDTGRIDMELEKVLCYAGVKPSLEQVREICQGNREAHFFALTEALGKRQLNAAMDAMAQTMANTKNEDGECIRLIRMSANYFRKLLHARIGMYVLGARNGQDLKRKVSSLSSAEREKLKGNTLLEVSEWQVGNLGEQASNYSGDELRTALQLFAQVDRTNVSSSLPRRLVLETLILQIIAGKQKKKRSA